MAAYFLGIGINDYPGTGSDLTGCVNDAIDWRNAMSKFAKSGSLLTDRTATKKNIIAAVKNLLRQLKSGDWAVITYSGHGTWVPDNDGDELDGRDECFVPYDWDNLIRDDEVHTLLQDRPAGTFVFLVSDSCNSGSVFRFASGLKGTDAPPRLRFLPPDVVLGGNKKLRKDAGSEREKAARIAKRVRASTPIISPGVVHFAGCRDVEFSYDASFNNRPNGAFTYAALDALRSATKRTTFNSWMTAIKRVLPSRSYPQTPLINARPSESSLLLPFLK